MSIFFPLFHQIFRNLETSPFQRRIPFRSNRFFHRLLSFSLSFSSIYFFYAYELLIVDHLKDLCPRVENKTRKGEREQLATR